MLRYEGMSPKNEWKLKRGQDLIHRRVQVGLHGGKDQADQASKQLRKAMSTARLDLHDKVDHGKVQDHVKELEDTYLDHVRRSSNGVFSMSERQEESLSNAFHGKKRNNEALCESDRHPFRSKFAFSQGKRFTSLITMAICINAIQMGVETDYPQYEVVYNVLEWIWVVLFGLEMTFKVIYSGYGYFKSAWNILDFFLVSLSIVDVVVLGTILGSQAGLKQLSVLRILRLLRIIKMVRLLKAFRELWLIVKGMIVSIPTICWASTLLVGCLYVFGIFTVQTIARNEGFAQGTLDSEYFPDFDVYQYYGTITRSMFTLWETSLEPLNIRPVVERQPEIFLFFVGFMFLTTFGVMNVIIGVIVDNTMQASKGADAEKAALELVSDVQKVDLVVEAVFALDADQSGTISVEEVEQGMANPDIAGLLGDLPLPTGCTADEFFMLMDSTGGGHVTSKDFTKHLTRALTCDPKRSLLELVIEIHQLEQAFHTGLARAEDRAAVLDGRLDGVEMALDVQLPARIGCIETALLALADRLGGPLPSLPPEPKPEVPVLSLKAHGGWPSNGPILDVSESTTGGVSASTWPETTPAVSSRDHNERALPPGIASLLNNTSSPADEPLCSARSTKSELFPIGSTDNDRNDQDLQKAEEQPKPDVSKVPAIKNFKRIHEDSERDGDIDWS